jgi:hypothetical protein
MKINVSVHELHELHELHEFSVFFHSYGMPVWGCCLPSRRVGCSNRSVFFLLIFAPKNKCNVLIYIATHIPSLTGREGDEGYRISTNIPSLTGRGRDEGYRISTHIPSPTGREGDEGCRISTNILSLTGRFFHRHCPSR